MNDIHYKAHENYCLSTLLLRTCHMQYCWLLMASIPSRSKRHPKQASRDAEQSRAKRTLRSATLHRLFFFAKAIAFASFATKQEAIQNTALTCDSSHRSTNTLTTNPTLPIDRFSIVLTRIPLSSNTTSAKMAQSAAPNNPFIKQLVHNGTAPLRPPTYLYTSLQHTQLTQLHQTAKSATKPSSPCALSCPAAPPSPTSTS